MMNLILVVLLIGFILALIFSIKLIKIIVTTIKLNCIVSIVFDSLFIVFFCYLIISQQKINYLIFIVIYLFAIVDCIRDLLYSERYYDCGYSKTSDDLFVSKGILSVLTLGIGRAVYLIAVYPIICICAPIKVKATLQKNKIVSSISSSMHYYNNRLKIAVEKGIRKGTILCNNSTVKENTHEYYVRNNKNNPKNVFESALEYITTSGRDRRKKREANNVQIFLESYKEVYIQRRYFMKCKKRFPNFLKAFGFLSIEDLIDKLESGGQIQEISRKPKAQIKFFVIFVLDTLCEEGIVETQDVNDEKYNDIKQYCVVGGKQMESEDIDDLLV